MSSMGKAMLYFLNVNVVDEGKPCGEIGSRRSWYHPNWGWYKRITCQPWCAGPHWKGTWYTISLLTWTYLQPMDWSVHDLEESCCSDLGLRVQVLEILGPPRCSGLGSPLCLYLVIWLLDPFCGHWRLLLTQKAVCAGFTNFGSSLFHFKSCQNSCHVCIRNQCCNCTNGLCSWSRRSGMHS